MKSPESKLGSVLFTPRPDVTRSKHPPIRLERKAVDFTKSKQGELLPSPEEYRVWIEAKILQEVQSGRYIGINPNAQSLKDDLRFWAYDSQPTPTPQDIIQFIENIDQFLENEVIKGSELHKRAFINELAAMCQRATKRMSGGILSSEQ